MRQRSSTGTASGCGGSRGTMPDGPAKPSGARYSWFAKAGSRIGGDSGAVAAAGASAAGGAGRGGRGRRRVGGDGGRREHGTEERRPKPSTNDPRPRHGSALALWQRRRFGAPRRLRAHPFFRSASISAADSAMREHWVRFSTNSVRARPAGGSAISDNSDRRLVSSQEPGSVVPIVRTVIRSPGRRPPSGSKGSPMGLLDFFRSRPSARGRSRIARLELERLEPRTVPAVTAALGAGVLTIAGGPGRETIHVSFNPANGALVVSDAAGPVAMFSSAAVQSIGITEADSGMITVDNSVLQPTTIQAGTGPEVIRTGGGPTTVFGGSGPDKLIAGNGPATLVGGTGQNTLYAGPSPDVLVGGQGRNQFFHVTPADTVISNPGDQVFPGVLPTAPVDPNAAQLTTTEVNTLLSRAAAADAADNAIVAIVDRGGNVLGVRVEGNVAPQITGNPATLSFAIDGALAEARTGAFFANDAGRRSPRAPIEFISQSTITQREVDSRPEHRRPELDAVRPRLRGPGRHRRPLPAGRAEHAAGGPVRHRGHQPRHQRFPRPGRDADAAGQPLQRADAVHPARAAAADAAGLLRLHLGHRPDGPAARHRHAAGRHPDLPDCQRHAGSGRRHRRLLPRHDRLRHRGELQPVSTTTTRQAGPSLEAEYIAFAAVGGAPGIGVARRHPRRHRPGAGDFVPGDARHGPHRPGRHHAGHRRAGRLQGPSRTWSQYGAGARRRRPQQRRQRAGRHGRRPCSRPAGPLPTAGWSRRTPASA